VKTIWRIGPTLRTRLGHAVVWIVVLWIVGAVISTLVRLSLAGIDLGEDRDRKGGSMSTSSARVRVTLTPLERRKHVAGDVHPLHCRVRRERQAMTKLGRWLWRRLTVETTLGGAALFIGVVFIALAALGEVTDWALERQRCESIAAQVFPKPTNSRKYAVEDCIRKALEGGGK